MRRLTTAPRAVWLIVALHGALLATYTVSFASFRAPDEPQHTDLVRYVRAEGDYPAYDERQLGRPVFNALDIVRFDVPAVTSRDLPEADAPPRSERPSFGELGSDLETVPDESNQLPSHPPLHYFVAGAVTGAVSAIPGDLAFDQEVGVLRLLGALMVLPLPLLAWATARRLRAGWSTGLAAAAVPLAVPQLHHIGASVTNDNLLTLLVGIATLLVARVITGDRSWRTALLLGVVTGLALLTKAFALFLPIWIMMAFALAVRRGWSWRGSLPRIAISLGVAFVVGGWWWARNLLVFGQLQTGIKLLDPAPAGFDPDPLWWLGRYFTLMPLRFWGSFGWFDVSIPAAAAIVATAVVVVLVAVGIASADSGRRRTDLAMMLIPLLAIAAMVAIGAFQGYLRTSFDEGLQGRYLFPGIVGLAAVVAWGLRDKRWAPLAVLVGAAAMQVTAWLTIVDFYWGGADVSAEIGSLVAWAPWDPAVLVLGAVLLVVATVATTAELVKETRQLK
ncbi:MAG: glycosyltransferase family 39 protein [Actinobacteria bacterium]|nr:glycosyltransferase family 39 protein [Actinomycetota bacterium]